MERRTATLSVTVNLDMLPGTMHTPESAEEIITAVLNEMIGRYRPVVSLQPTTSCGHPFYQKTKDGLTPCGESFCNNYIH
jgi:hypothetical protein